MKTSLIQYRVADFLKQFPPFDSLDEPQLLALAASGKVSFHESGEYIFRQHQDCNNRCWVLQQGIIHVLDTETEHKPLIDIAATGDLIGLEPLTDFKTYRHTAVTQSDVILYSVDVSLLAALMQQNRALQDYVSLYFSTHDLVSQTSDTTSTHPAFKRALSHQLNLPIPSAYFEAHSVSVSEPISIKDLLALSAIQQGRSVCVVNQARQPIGLVNLQQIMRSLSQGNYHPASPLTLIAIETLTLMPPDLSWVNYLNAMISKPSMPVVLTTDGHSESAFKGLISDEDLLLQLGNNPASLIRAIHQADSMTELDLYWQQSRALIDEIFSDPSQYELASAFGSQLFNSLLNSLIRQSKSELAHPGNPAFNTEFCCLILDKTGYYSLLNNSQPELWMVHNSDEPLLIQQLQALSCQLSARLSSLTTPLINPDIQMLSLRDVQEQLSAIVSHPVENQVFDKRYWFDFSYHSGNRALAQQLEQHLQQAFTSHPAFIKILANDTLENLPPLTFYDDQVIGIEGDQQQALNLEQFALMPITDAIRVQALAAKSIQIQDTVQRIRLLEQFQPDHKPLLQQASEAFRFLAYFQQHCSRHGQPATAILPGLLSRYDQRRLKTAFKAIHDLLMWTMMLIEPGHDR